MIKLENKKGQMTIWVIIAAILLGSILLYLYTERSTFSLTRENTDPKPYIERCARQHIDEAITKMLPQGGFIEPKNFKWEDGIKREFLCRHAGYYRACINQHPMYLNDLKDEIKNYIRPEIEQCFNNLRDELAKNKETMKMGVLNVSVEIMPSRVRANIVRNVTIGTGDESVIIEDFDAEILSPLYELANVAIEITNEEVRHCYFEYTTYDLMHPNIKITRNVKSDSTKIYSVEDKDTLKELTFAVRGCGIPPGYGA
jgi:hypothetical protein